MGALAAIGTVPAPPLSVWRLSTHRHVTADEVGVTLRALIGSAGLDLSLLRAVAVASVVPPLDPVFRDVAIKSLQCPAFFVDAGVKTGVKVLLDNPKEVGADRVVNAAAAFARVKGPLIVADFGTATTFDCVDRAGAYLGGAIAPGPQMAAETLYQRTAKLPLVGSLRKPSKAIGKNTQDSIASGLFHGYVGLTRGILASLKSEMRGKTRILATGGLASLLAPSLPEIEGVFPDLTLEGIWLIWRLNVTEK